jgi:hypothetical protein
MLKPVAILSWSLDLLTMALSRQLFRETVPLTIYIIGLQFEDYPLFDNWLDQLPFVMINGIDSFRTSLLANPVLFLPQTDNPFEKTGIGPDLRLAKSH